MFSTKLFSLKKSENLTYMIWEKYFNDMKARKRILLAHAPSAPI